MAQAERLPRGAATIADPGTMDEVETAPAAPLLQGVPLSLPPARPETWPSDAASLAAALVMHGGLLLAIVAAAGNEPVGGGSELDAINIEMVAQSEVLEALAIDPTAQVTARAARPQLADAPAAAESAGQDRQKTEQAEGTVAPDETVPEPVDNDDPNQQGETVRAAAAAENSRASEPSIAARGTDALDPGAPALVAAPPGVEREYARTVLFALARNRPKASAGSRGTVRIGFTVSASGKVGSVRVARSSGMALLDEAALAAVSSTVFPAPPPQLGNGMLAYEIPYIFR